MSVVSEETSRDSSPSPLVGEGRGGGSAVIARLG